MLVAACPMGAPGAAAAQLLWSRLAGVWQSCLPGGRGKGLAQLGDAPRTGPWLAELGASHLGGRGLELVSF